MAKDIDDTRDTWPGFSAAEASAWSRTLLRHSPDPLRALFKALIHEALESGRLPGVGDWASTADRARTDGFTPALYALLFSTLSTISPRDFRSHPTNRQITHPGYLPGTPYESELWSDWPRLVVDDGLDPRDAAELLLLHGDHLGAGGNGRGDVSLDE